MNGYTATELLTPGQIDAMAETLWDFTWNHDPNDPHFGEQRWEDAGGPAKRHYREWARAVYLAAERREAQHVWNRDFPRSVADSGLNPDGQHGQGDPNG